MGMFEGPKPPKPKKPAKSLFGKVLGSKKRKQPTRGPELPDSDRLGPVEIFDAQFEAPDSHEPSFELQSRGTEAIVAEFREIYEEPAVTDVATEAPAAPKETREPERSEEDKRIDDAVNFLRGKKVKIYNPESGVEEEYDVHSLRVRNGVGMVDGSSFDSKNAFSEIPLDLVLAQHGKQPWGLKTMNDAAKEGLKRFTADKALFTPENIADIESFMSGENTTGSLAREHMMRAIYDYLYHCSGENGREEPERYFSTFDASVTETATTPDGSFGHEALQPERTEEQKRIEETVAFFRDKKVKIPRPENGKEDDFEVDSIKVRNGIGMVVASKEGPNGERVRGEFPLDLALLQHGESPWRIEAMNDAARSAVLRFMDAAPPEMQKEIDRYFFGHENPAPERTDARLIGSVYFYAYGENGANGSTDVERSFDVHSTAAQEVGTAAPSPTGAEVPPVVVTATPESSGTETPRTEPSTETASPELHTPLTEEEKMVRSREALRDAISELQGKQIWAYNVATGEFEQNFILENGTVNNGVAMARVRKLGSTEPMSQLSLQSMDEILSMNGLQPWGMRYMSPEAQAVIAEATWRDHEHAELITDVFSGRSDFGQLTPEQRRVIEQLRIQAYSAKPGFHNENTGAALPQQQTESQPQQESQPQPKSAGSLGKRMIEAFKNLPKNVAERAKSIPQNVIKFLKENPESIGYSVAGFVAFRAMHFVGIQAIRDLYQYGKQKAVIDGYARVFEKTRPGMAHTLEDMGRYLNQHGEQKPKGIKKDANVTSGRNQLIAKRNEFDTSPKGAEYRALREAKRNGELSRKDARRLEELHEERFPMRESLVSFREQLGVIKGGDKADSPERQLLRNYFNEATTLEKGQLGILKLRSEDIVSKYMETKMSGVQALRSATTAAIMTYVYSHPPVAVWAGKARVMTMGFFDVWQKRNDEERFNKIQNDLRSQEKGYKKLPEQLNIQSAVSQAATRIYHELRGKPDASAAEQQETKRARIKALAVVTNYALAGGALRPFIRMGSESASWISEKASNGIDLVSEKIPGHLDLHPGHWAAKVEDALRLHEHKTAIDAGTTGDVSKSVESAKKALDAAAAVGAQKPDAEILKHLAEQAPQDTNVRLEAPLVGLDAKSGVTPEDISQTLEKLKVSQDDLSRLVKIELAGNPSLHNAHEALQVLREAKPAEIEQFKEIMGNRDIAHDVVIETQARFRDQAAALEKVLGKDSPAVQAIMAQNNDRLSDVLTAQAGGGKHTEADVERAFRVAFGENPTLHITDTHVLGTMIQNSPEVQTFYSAHENVPINARNIVAVVEGKGNQVLQAMNKHVDAELFDNLAANARPNALMNVPVASGAAEDAIRQAAEIKTQMAEITGGTVADVDNLMHRVGAQTNEGLFAVIRRVQLDRHLEDPQQALRMLAHMNDQQLGPYAEVGREQGTLRPLSAAELNTVGQPVPQSVAETVGSEAAPESTPEPDGEPGSAGVTYPDQPGRLGSYSQSEENFLRNSGALKPEDGPAPFDQTQRQMDYLRNAPRPDQQNYLRNAPQGSSRPLVREPIMKQSEGARMTHPAWEPGQHGIRNPERVPSALQVHEVPGQPSHIDVAPPPGLHVEQVPDSEIWISKGELAPITDEKLNELRENYLKLPLEDRQKAENWANVAARYHLRPGVLRDITNPIDGRLRVTMDTNGDIEIQDRFGSHPYRAPRNVAADPYFQQAFEKPVEETYRSAYISTRGKLTEGETTTTDYGGDKQTVHLDEDGTYTRISPRGTEIWPDPDNENPMQPSTIPFSQTAPQEQPQNQMGSQDQMPPRARSGERQPIFKEGSRGSYGNQGYGGGGNGGERQPIMKNGSQGYGGYSGERQPIIKNGSQGYGGNSGGRGYNSGEREPVPPVWQQHPRGIVPRGGSGRRGDAPSININL